MAYDFSDFTKHSNEVVEWLRKEFSGIRTGRASIALLDGVLVDSYGVKTPLNQVASLSVEGPRTLRVVPWDKGVIPEIEKAIAAADLGVSTGSDDEGVRVNFPELSAENRENLVRIAKKKLEEARVSLRNVRGDVIKDIDQGEKDGEIPKDDARRYKDELQKKVDAVQKELESLAEAKEKEITG